MGKANRACRDTKRSSALPVKSREAFRSRHNQPAALVAAQLQKPNENSFISELTLRLEDSPRERRGLPVGHACLQSR